MLYGMIVRQGSIMYPAVIMILRLGGGSMRMVKYQELVEIS